MITMRIAFKPTSTIARKQHTVTRDRHETELIARGRHDPCVVPRAVPMVEAMVALVILDQLMVRYAQCQLLPINPCLQEPVEAPKLEDFDVREFAISVTGRLSEKNPAYVLHALRRHLIQLLMHLEQSANSKCREESDKLLGCLIRNLMLH
ncbi:chorismate synthase 2, chloroplastic-like isoform X6 [Magnolia sinica]|uniref:chorismate synthase 2, chloroplastic-like isoform X6 n=1 Tax=Magnolia sinica TaxID=86752 RepID=UPI002657AF06|nr:chorismate synthase 2, chloroplastic-like isoform X6 [Magnolia sinica]